MPFDLFYLPFRPAISPNSLVVPGAQLGFYVSGTNTPQPVYADEGLTIELENPVRANAAGKWPPIYIDNALTYRVRLTDELGAVLDEVDPYVPGAVGGPKGDPGASDNTYPTLALMAASPTARGVASVQASPSDPGVRYYWTPGDFSGRIDGVTYVASTNTPVSSGAWVLQQAQSVAFKQPETDAVPLALQRILERTIDPVDYGAKLDGVTDDTLAWRRALRAARDRGVSRVVCSYGATGVSLCGSAVWDTVADGPFPSSIEIDGLARNTASNVGAPAGYSAGVTMRYTGTGVLWPVNYSAGTLGGLPSECGQWEWRNLTVACMNPAGTAFDFNDTPNAPVTEGPDAPGPSYLRGIRFKNVSVFGQRGGAAQTGDGIRAAKCFELHIDKGCYIRDFRRGVWLKGSDNCKIDARLDGNGRNIMLSRTNTFGSWAKISTEWLGRVYPAGGETSHLVWDNMTNTSIIGVGLEQAAPGSAASLLYLDGRGTQIIGCGGAGAPLFHIGPNAGEILIDNFGVSISPPEWGVVIDNAASNDWGYDQQDKRIRIRNGSLNLQTLVGAHPRVIWEHQVDGQLSIPDLYDPVVDANGVRIRNAICSARGYWGKSEGTPAFGGVELVQEDGAFCGWAIRCNRMTAGAGFFLIFSVGADFAVGDLLQVRLRSRNPGATGSDSWRLSVMRNNNAPSLTNIYNGEAYGVTNRTVDLSGYSTGDTVAIGIQLAAAPTTDLLTDALSVSVVSPAIADLTATPTAADFNRVLAAIRRFEWIAS